MEGHNHRTRSGLGDSDRQYRKTTVTAGTGTSKDDYGLLYAEFYDILHAGLEDVNAYLEFASKYGSKILELGCGTGRILIPLTLAGHNVTGVDLSDAMLNVCRERIGYESPEVQGRARLIASDIRHLDLPDQFDMVMAPCGFMEYFHEPGDDQEMLRTAQRHLDGDGVFLLDCGVPDLDYMQKVDGALREYEFTHPISGADILYAVTSRYDFTRQTQEDEVHLLERDNGLVLREERYIEKRCYRFPPQVRRMLEHAGFAIVREQGSLMESIPISGDCGEMVFLCRRKD